MTREVRRAMLLAELELRRAQPGALPKRSAIKALAMTKIGAR